MVRQDISIATKTSGEFMKDRRLCMVSSKAVVISAADILYGEKIPHRQALVEKYCIDWLNLLYIIAHHAPSNIAKIAKDKPSTVGKPMDSSQGAEINNCPVNVTFLHPIFKNVLQIPLGELKGLPGLAEATPADKASQYVAFRPDLTALNIAVVAFTFKNYTDEQCKTYALALLSDSEALEKGNNIIVIMYFLCMKYNKQETLTELRRHLQLPDLIKETISVLHEEKRIADHLKIAATLACFFLQYGYYSELEQLLQKYNGLLDRRAYNGERALDCVTSLCPTHSSTEREKDTEENEEQEKIAANIACLLLKYGYTRKLLQLLTGNSYLLGILDYQGNALVHYLAENNSHIALWAIHTKMKGNKLALVNSSWDTPLHIAARNNSSIICFFSYKLLELHKIKRVKSHKRCERFLYLLTIQNIDGLTPLHIAIRNNHSRAIQSVLELCQEYGDWSLFTKKHTDGNTLVDFAVQCRAQDNKHKALSQIFSMNPRLLAKQLRSSKPATNHKRKCGGRRNKPGNNNKRKKTASNHKRQCDGGSHKPDNKNKYAK